MRVKSLEDGDGAFVGGPGFINEGAAGDFEGFWEKAGGEDEGDEALKLLKPDRVKAGEKVEGETAKSGFGWDMLDDVMKGWESRSEVGFGRRG